MEQLIYESRPYLYLGSSLGTFLKLGDSQLAVLSGMTLFLCGMFVLHMRHEHRKQEIK